MTILAFGTFRVPPRGRVQSLRYLSSPAAAKKTCRVAPLRRPSPNSMAGATTGTCINASSRARPSCAAESYSRAVASTEHFAAWWRWSALKNRMDDSLASAHTARPLFTKRRARLRDVNGRSEAGLRIRTSLDIALVEGLGGIAGIPAGEVRPDHCTKTRIATNAFLRGSCRRSARARRSHRRAHTRSWRRRRIGRPARAPWPTFAPGRTYRTCAATGAAGRPVGAPLASFSMIRGRPFDGRVSRVVTSVNGPMSWSL